MLQQVSNAPRRRRWRWIVGAIAAAGVLAAAAWFVGARVWHARILELHERLMQARREPVPAVYSERELDALPANVQRYFRAVLRPGQPLVANVLLQHSGTLRLGGDSWAPFTSWQCVTPQRPGFVWNAKVHMASVLPVRVHDAYIAGAGLTDAAILGLLSIGEMRGAETRDGGAFASAQLLRFFAEAVWYPTALLPSQGVEWTPVDTSHARAVLRDGDFVSAATFGFDDAGRIATVRVEARVRTVGDQLVPTPWSGRFWDYAEREGMQVPLEAEVAWEVAAGPHPYWRARLESIGYEWAK